LRTQQWIEIGGVVLLLLLHILAATSAVLSPEDNAW
jgi:hypothetical protein